MFYSGTLQEGITLALQETKAVVCFVTDDNETSSMWEEEYFTNGEEFTQLLATKSVLLRITKDSPEAGFLASVCPISQYPTTAVIRNGMLREYLAADISQEDFRSRLTAVLDDSKPDPIPQASSPSVGSAPQNYNAGPSTLPAMVTAEPATTKDQSNRGQGSAVSDEKRKVDQDNTPKNLGKSPVQNSLKTKEVSRPSINVKKPNSVGGPKAPISSIRAHEGGQATSESSKANPTPTTVPPSQYRLQVRLFDGSSVRTTFSPSQTIRRDVRSWLDTQMEEGKQPYKLKHILTPSPNRTLTIAEEEQTLEELIHGSTATLVMIPIPSYTRAYSSAVTRLPARVALFIYWLISSAFSMATGFVGNFLSSGQAASSEPELESASSTSSSQATSDTARGIRLRSFPSNGSNIRTLRDQQNEHDRNQFYNGNQLNFEPRSDDDEQ